MMRKFRARGAAGFTLVEMMVVIVIIGILAAAFVVQITGRADKARVEATKAIIRQVADAVEMFKLNHKVYPENLIDLVRPPAYIDARDWPPGGYLSQPPKDGWGRDLIYRPGGTPGYPYDIVSLGEDGRDGGEGYAEDLWNHGVYRR